MTPAERLQAAITKLESLWADVPPGSVEAADERDQEYIDTLQRTVGAQIAIMRTAGRFEHIGHNVFMEDALALADAILGEAS